MKTLYIDVETYSATPIKAGTARYAETSEIMIVAYAMDNEPVQVWDRTAQRYAPVGLVAALADPGVRIKAWNAMFERQVFLNDPFFRAAALDVGRWWCCMVQAMLHGFPGSLSGACRALGLPEDRQKSDEGRNLIRRFTKPPPPNHIADRYDRDTHPAEWRRFLDYAEQDVVAMRAATAELPTWNCALDMPLWHLDQVINDRGFKVDVDLAEAGARASVAEKKALTAQFLTLVNGAVGGPTQRAKLLAYMEDRWAPGIPNTRRETLEAYIRDNPNAPCDLVELMHLVMSANKTSTAKYATLASATSRDGRFRCGLAFSGAARTRRYAGRTFQPQNLPSRGLPPQDEIDRYAAALKTGTHRDLDVDHNNVASAALRNLIVASKGHKLAVADYAAIEGRVLAWLAGEEWKVDAYAQGQDIYSITAATILGKTAEEITKEERSCFGKVPELALGFQSGAVGLARFSDMYGFRFTDLNDTIRANSYDHYINARYNWDAWGHEKADDIARDEWVLCETVKLAWRQANKRITTLWADMDSAVRRYGGTVGGLLRVSLEDHAGISYLCVHLPSGRIIPYARPHVSERTGIRVEEVNSLTRQWGVTTTYAGRLVQNATQSIARDVLVDTLPKLERAGFSTVLTVHDEVIAECDESKSWECMASIMAKGHRWTGGLPLAADGFEVYRYRK